MSDIQPSNQTTRPLDERLHDLAHSLNNLLTIIRGFAEIAQEEATRAGLKSESIGQIVRATNRAELLTQELADLRTNKADAGPSA